MIIKKVFNNNVSLVKDGDEEKILMGKGIGFQKQSGDEVDTQLIEKTFVLSLGSHPLEKLTTFFDEIPLEIVALTSDLIQDGQVLLGKHVGDHLLIPLSDHIWFALKRLDDQTVIDYPLKWEMKHMYPEEYTFAKKALQTIQKRTRRVLPPSEVVPIAMHFVNARYGANSYHQTYEMTALVSKIIDVIHYHYFVDLNEDSLHYARFITHLRYFILRQMAGEENTSEEEDVFQGVIQQKYPKAYECAIKIKKLLETSMNWKVHYDELTYLTIHIQRLTTV
ncbi:PRD domain-containing protein [Alkalihalobacillus sp. FSL W8-0930]